MKIRTTLSILALAAATSLITSCNETNQPKKIEQNQTQNHKVEILKIEQTNNYTYLFVKENSEEFWMAIDRSDDYQLGETIYFADAMLMEDFESKELGKTFDKIFFISKTSKTPIDKQAEWFNSSHNTNSSSGTMAEVDAEPLNGYSIEKLYADKKEKAGSTIKMRGVVVRFNEKIMNSNWVHLQDGTGTTENGNFDLTITTQEKVTLGDTVIFEGTITLDKDFGAGYFYSLIMENGTLVNPM